MGIFDLLFLALAFTALLALLAAAWSALRKRFGRAGRILRWLLAGTAAYIAVVIGVSAALPRRVDEMNVPRCFDDWCLTVRASRRTPVEGGVKYTVDLLLSSQARRISQREKNLAVYLTDSRGRRFDPEGGASPERFSVLLGPGESSPVECTFLLPADAADVGLVITHEGGFPIGWLIIGYDSWFRKPEMLRLP